MSKKKNSEKENGKGRRPFLPDIIIIYEHKSDKVKKEYEGFTLYDSRKYGIATFDFYKESL